MKNRFMLGELVLVEGMGKIQNTKKVNEFGIIKQKEYYYNEYLIELLTSKRKDWFKEQDIEMILERKNKKMEKYKVALAIDRKGFDIIKKEIQKNYDAKNDIFRKANLVKKYKVKKKEYVILAWSSTYWPMSNYSVEIIEKTLDILREKNIAYQRIIIGETDPTYVQINEFIDNDENVNILEPVMRIKIRNIGGILI